MDDVAKQIDELVANTDKIKIGCNELDESRIIDVVLRRKLRIDDDQINNEKRDAQWLFVVHSLSLLSELKTEITKTLSISDQSLPILSVKATSNVTKLLNIVSSLGLKPYLLPGLIPSTKSQFESALKSVTNVDIEERYKRLVYVTTSLLDLLRETHLLRGLLLSNLLLDIMAALFQMGHTPLMQPGKSKDNFVMTEDKFESLSKQQERFKIMLSDLCSQVHQPMIINKLLLIQGRAKAHNKPRKWLMDACNALLVSRLIQDDNGVLNVARSVLEPAMIADASQEIVDKLARLIATEPSNMQVETYYSKIQVQLMRLLAMRNSEGSVESSVKSDALSYSLVASRALFLASERNFNTTSEKLMAPLFLELQLMKNPNRCEMSSKIELSSSLETLHYLFVLTNASCADFLGHLKDFLPQLFDIYVFAFFTPCLARKHTEELITKCVNAQDDEEPVAILRSLGPINDLSRSRKFGLNENGHLILSFETDNPEEEKGCEDDDNRATVVNALVEKLNNPKVASSFFSSLLTDLSHFLAEEDEDDGQESAFDLTTFRKQLFVVRVLGVLSASQSILDELMKNSEFVTDFVASTLRRGALLLSSSSPLLIEGLNMALTLLSVQLASGVSESTWDKLTSSKSDLEQLSSKTKDERVRLLSKKVLAIITAKGLMNDMENLDEGLDGKRSAYGQAMFDLTDPLVAVRGHALIELRRLIQTRDQETIGNLQKIIDVFKANLADDDTYVYQPSIDGLVACCDIRTEEVIAILVDEYNSSECNEDDAMVRTTKAGEALVRVTQQLAELTPKYREQLVNPFLHQLNNKDPLIRASALSNLGEVCKNLRFSLGPLVSEIVSHLRSVLEWERCSEVRSAALLVLRLMLEGLDRDAFIVLRDEMRDIYRCLLRLRDQEWESSTRLHLQLVLDQVDDLVKSALTTEPKLVKKIVVIDP